MGGYRIISFVKYFSNFVNKLIVVEIAIIYMCQLIGESLNKTKHLLLNFDCGYDFSIKFKRLCRLIKEPEHPFVRNVNHITVVFSMYVSPFFMIR